MSELEICAAAFFRNKGREVVTEKEFVMGVSLDYRWMTAEDAKKLAAKMISEGILEKKDGYLRPKRKLAADLPVAYRPSQDLVGSLGKPPAEERLVFSEMMEIAKNTELGGRGFAKKTRETRDRLDVIQEVAGLLVLRDQGVDVSDFYEIVKEAIVSR